MKTKSLISPGRTALTAVHQRRTFFKAIGTALFSLPLVNCSTTTMGPGEGVDLGSGDTGILNFALALEQLEAEYYSRVVQHPYAGITSQEAQILRDIRDHEIAHREFLRGALGAKAIPQLQFDFSKVNFNSRASVLRTAQIFEDLGVAAYDGAGTKIKDPAILVEAGKIVSVEARHATIIRMLISPNTEYFSEAALDNGDGFAKVLKQADPFIVTKLNGNHLPA